MLDMQIKIPEYIGERVVNKKIWIINQKKDKVWIYNERAIEVWRKLREGEKIANLDQAYILKFIISLYERDLIECNPQPSEKSNEELKAHSDTIQLGYECYKSHTVLNAMFELTYKCNERCLHCYISNKPERELSFEEVKTALIDLKAMGCHKVHFTGGEIFCRKDIFDIIKFSQDQGFLIGIFSNGTLITPEVANLLSRFHLSFVKVSLYGLVAETHDRITAVDGSFNKTINAIKILREHNLKVKIGFMLFDHNAKELINVEEFCKQLDAEYSIELKIFPRQDNSVEPLKYMASDDDMRLFMKSSKLVGPITKTICLAGQTKLKINPLGDVYPCEYWRKPIGNIRDEKLPNIWNSKGNFDVINFVRNYKILKCESCEFNSDCFVCPALVDVETDFTPAQFCKWAQLSHCIN